MSMQLIQKKRLPVDDSGAFEQFDYLINGRVAYIGEKRRSRLLGKPSNVIIVEDPKSGLSHQAVTFNQLADTVTNMQVGSTVHLKGRVDYVGGRQQFTVAEILNEVPPFLVADEA